MAFMIPEYEHMACYRVETTHGTETVPRDVAGVVTSADGLRDYLGGTPISDDVDVVEGWYCRLSAPGYLDATDWAGPFETEAEARAYIRETYDVDDETGDDLEDES